MLLLLLGLMSCVGFDDKLAEHAFGIGLPRVGEVAAAAVQFRQLHGAWPAEPTDLRPLIADPDLDLNNVQKAIRFRAGLHGLVFVDRRSGDRLLVVSDKSTPKHLALYGTDTSR